MRGSADRAVTFSSLWSSTRSPGSMAEGTLLPPYDHQAAVIRRARAVLHRLHEPLSPVTESGHHKPVSLAEQPVDPGLDVDSRLLDQTDGVQHQRVTSPQRATFWHVTKVRHHAEHYAARLGQPPRAARRFEVSGRRMPGRRDHVVPCGQIKNKMHSGNKTLRGVATPQVGVAGRQELRRWHGAEQAAERAGQYQRPGTSVDALSSDIDHGDLKRIPVAHGYHKIATEQRPARGPEHR